MLFALNYFLISYSLEGRVYSFYCLISLCFINSYVGSIDNKEDQKIIKILMGDEVAPRKEFITNNALDVANLDI